MASPRSASQRPAPGDTIPLSQTLAFGLPVIGVSGTLFFVQFFFLKFATDVLLLPPALVGTIFAVGRLWDAISDPLVGTWSDRTRTRLGRRRPWMFAAVPGLGLTYVAIYAPPEGLGATALLAWVTVALLAFYTTLTAYIVPHQALGAELTTGHHARSRLFAVRHASFTLGIMFAFGASQFVNNAVEPRATAATLVMVTAFLFSAVLLVPPVTLRERADYVGRGSESSFRAMADVLRNTHARRVLAVTFADMMGAGVLGVLSPFIFEYVLERPDLIGPLPAVFVVCSIASIPFWMRISRRYGKRDVWVVALLLLSLSFGAIAFAQAGEVVYVGVLLVVAGLASGCGGMMSPSIMADAIDYDESRSGERKEGAYTAAWGFVLKASNALIIFLTGVVLQLSGFEPNAEQTPGALLALRLLFGGLPFTMFLLAALILRGLRLDEAEHARIREEIDSRGR